MNQKQQEQRAIGCLVGGAYGDSLGAGVEFASSKQIKDRYGPDGIKNLDLVFGRTGNITDDTQMAIATAEGLTNTPTENDQIIQANLWLAYQRWYQSQTLGENRRAPGNTCLRSLKNNIPGTTTAPINTSPGCGGIMRAHPIGLAFSDRQRAYRIGTDSAALTHGHENAYIPAGFFSALVSRLTDGQNFDQALASTNRQVGRKTKSEQTKDGIKRAVFADTNADSFEVIDNQVGGGGGWLGHDALAIAVYAVRRAAADPLESVRVAVNHSGDSDSTGSIAGAIAGTIHGPEPFFGALKDQDVELEHVRRLGRLAVDLVKMRS